MMRIQAETQRGHAVTITVDGAAVQAYLGETIAGALLASGQRAWRRTSQGKPRGLFCGMGICFDCTVTVDGVPNVRACLTPVAEGMVVDTHEPGQAAL
jgi:aerobic-type carbon monoxide dehydrogenase small subunit (CoxS/CutS family)